jgi:hypothetical protein
MKKSIHSCTNLLLKEEQTKFLAEKGKENSSNSSKRVRLALHQLTFITSFNFLPAKIKERRMGPKFSVIRLKMGNILTQ